MSASWMYNILVILGIKVFKAQYLKTVIDVIIQDEMIRYKMFN